MIETSNLTVCAGSFCLRDLTFAVPSGAYGVLMGRSGNGKTTLLETLCGLRRPVSGRVRLAGRDVTRLRPAERSVGYVPQDGALFSGMSVRDQLGFSLHVRRRKSPEIARRTRELAEWLEIGHLLDRTPQGLSGGEAQRVALGRALAFEPSTLLLDEPLSALDDDTRDQMYAVLSRITAHEHVTVLHVTHNRQDAARLADLVLRLENNHMSAQSRQAFLEHASSLATDGPSAT